MANVSPNSINSLNDDWSNDSSNNQPYSGEAVLTFIKSYLGVIAKDSYFDPQTATIYYFASSEDKASYIDNPQGSARLVLFSTPITFSSELYRIYLSNYGNVTRNIATNATETILSADYLTLKKAVTDSDWTPTNHSVLVTISVDLGNTGTYVDYGLPQRCSTGTFSTNVRSLLTEGINRIKLTFVDEEDDEVINSITFTITLTNLFIEPSNNRWYEPIIEDGDSNTYRLGGFRIIGTMNKTVHFNIYSASNTLAATFSKEVGTNVYDQYPFFFSKTDGFDLSNLTTGVYYVSAYLTAGSGTAAIESNKVEYSFMYVASGDTLSAKLVCINDASPIVYNYATTNWFKYAVYNCGDTTASPHITVSSNMGTTPGVIINEDLDNVRTGVANTYPIALELLDDKISGLSVWTTLTLGTSSLVLSTPVDNTATFPPTTDYDFYMNSSSRSNTDNNKEKIVNIATNTELTPIWTDMTWVNADGWIAPEDDRKSLLIQAKSKLELPYTLYLLILDSPLYGRTFEICYKVSNVADYDETIISVAEKVNAPDFKGIRIKPTNITVHSALDNSSANDSTRSVNVKDEEVIHFVLTISPNYNNQLGKNLVTGYINGCKNFLFDYGSTTNAFNVEAPLVIGGLYSDVNVYFIRTYKIALGDVQVAANYVNSKGTVIERTSLFDELKGVTNYTSGKLIGNQISYKAVKDSGYNYFVIEMLNGASVPSLANGWQKDSVGTSNLEMHFGLHPSWDWKLEDVETAGQGTTSMNYYRWNLRWRIDKSHGDDKKVYVSTLSSRDNTTGTYKYNWNEHIYSKTVYFDGSGNDGNNHPAVKRITAKINAASSMLSHKIGATRAYTELHNAIGLTNEAMLYATNNSLPKPTVAVYEYPAFGFSKNGNDYSYIGLFTIGPDKGDKPTFGYDISSVSEKLITMEGSDHGHPAVMFNHRWTSDMKYASDEFLNVGESASSRGGWEISNCYDLNTKNQVSEIQNKLNTEFKPAYEVAFNNSTRLIAIPLNEYGETADATLATINSDVTTFRNAIRLGNSLSNFNYLFWIEGLYIPYYYDLVENKYKPSMEDDMLTDLNDYFGTSDVLPEGSTLEEQNEWFKAKRRHRFIETAGNYWDLNDAMYHYAFLLIIGAVDNFGKNTYPYLMAQLSNGGTGRWKWRLDDLDSALGINNSGVDNIPVTSEYNDASNGNALYGGSASVFWTLIHECFIGTYDIDMPTRPLINILTIGKDIFDLMAILGAEIGVTGTVNLVVNYFKKRFWDNAQNYFPTSAYNLDANFKYVEAWLANGQNVPPLTQSLGNHYSAERLWVYNRVVYLMSLFNAGPFGAYNADAIGRVSFRPSNLSGVTLKYILDIYPALGDGQTVIHGSHTPKGQSYTFNGTFSPGGQTEVSILASDVITDFGDWKNLILGSEYTAPIAINGRKLKQFKIGDELASVTTNVPGLSFTKVPCLEEINALNASSISGSLDLSQCTRLLRAYLKGTSLTNVILADGQKIKEISYPDSVQTLTMKNLRLLTSENIELPSTLADLTTVQIENCAVDTFDLLYNAYSEENSQLSYISVLVPEVVEMTNLLFQFLYNLATNKDNEGNTKIYHGINNLGVGDNSLNPVVDGYVLLSTPYYLSLFEDIVDSETIENYGEDGLKVGRIPSLTSLRLIYNPGNRYVEFADTNVRDIILSNFNHEYNDGILLREILNITSLGTVFRNNTDIVSFDEFQEFTNCTTVSQNAFDGCTNLESIKFPAGIAIGQYSFRNCTGFTSITLSSCTLGQLSFQNCTNLYDVYLNDTVTFAGYRVFESNGAVNGIRIHVDDLEWACTALYGNYGLSNCTIGSHGTSSTAYLYVDDTKIENLVIPSTITVIPQAAFQCFTFTTVTIPSSVTTIRATAFCYCKGLSSITINATTPPTLDNSNAFTNGTPNNYPIYVPAASVSAYKAATNWSSLASRIQAIP